MADHKKHQGEHLERNVSDRKMPSKDDDKHRVGRDDETKAERQDANRDPISNAPGSHPVGTGLGAAGGAAAGAAVGMVAGPVGAATGGVIGAIVGGLAGKGVAEHFDPTHEHKYWQENFSDRDYVDAGARYERYSPAYQYGWESYVASAKKDKPNEFERAEPELGRRWEEHRADTDLPWEEARPAARDAWDRTHREYGSDIGR